MINDSKVFLGNEYLPNAPVKCTIGTYRVSAFAPSQFAEDSTAAVLIFGYIHNPDVLISPAYWLTLLQQPAPMLVAALDQLNGAYNLLVLNKVNNSISVVTDRLGGQRMYYWSTQEGIWLSPSLTGLANIANFGHGTPTNFSVPAVMELLNYRWLSGTTTPFADINKLPHAAVCQLSPGSSIHTLVRYGILPEARAGVTDESLQVHADRVHQLLLANIRASVRPGDRVAVLLSGGVDSSILLGICCDLNLNVVAITPQHEGHHNPELETAKTFAAELGVEHRIIAVEEADVARHYADVVELLGVPPRCHSAVSLLILLRQLKGSFDKILYGEGADTLFGSKAVKHFALRFKKNQRLKKVFRYIPYWPWLFKVLPLPYKLRHLLQFDALNEAIAVNQIVLQEPLKASLNDRLVLDKELIKAGLNVSNVTVDTYERALLQLKQIIFSSSVINHFYELESLAADNSIQLISPFVCQPVMAYAASLSDTSYFGIESVKPVLRKIGERYFTPSLMYLPKYGFPVPHSNWLKGPLATWGREATVFFSCPIEYLADEEFAWCIIGLYLLAKRNHILPLRLFEIDGGVDAPPG